MRQKQSWTCSRLPDLRAGLIEWGIRYWLPAGADRSRLILQSTARYAPCGASHRTANRGPERLDWVRFAGVSGAHAANCRSHVALFDIARDIGNHFTPAGTHDGRPISSDSIPQSLGDNLKEQNKGCLVYVGLVTDAFVRKPKMRKSTRAYEVQDALDGESEHLALDDSRVLSEQLLQFRAPLKESLVDEWRQVITAFRRDPKEPALSQMRACG